MQGKPASSSGHDPLSNSFSHCFANLPFLTLSHPLPFPEGVFLNLLIKLGPHGHPGNSNHLPLFWAAHSQDCPWNDTAICGRGCRAIPHPAHPPRRLSCQRVTCSSARKGLTAGAATVLTLPIWSLAAPRCNQAAPTHISLQRLGRQSLAKVLQGGKKALNWHVAVNLSDASLLKPQIKHDFTVALKVWISPAFRHWDGSPNKGWAASSWSPAARA